MAASHGGGWAAFSDGLVRLVPADTPPATVKAWLSKDGPDAAAIAGLKVNDAAKDLKTRSEDFMRRLSK